MIVFVVPVVNALGWDIALNLCVELQICLNLSTLASNTSNLFNVGVEAYSLGNEN